MEEKILNLRINMEINDNESLRRQILGWPEKRMDIKEVEENSWIRLTSCL